MNFFKSSLFIVLFFITKINLVYAADNTAFLNIDYILNNSNLGKSIVVELENLNKSNVKKLDKKEKILKEKKEKIDKTKNISSKEKFREDVDKFNKEVATYRDEKNKILNDFKKLKKKKLDNFLEKINPIIQEYMKNNSIGIMVEKNQIFMGNSDNDATGKIIELINSKL
jgi:outer membrane protein